MKDPKQFAKTYKLRKKQGVPSDADPATHERCVQHLKDQGHSKESAFKICNAAGAGKKSLEKAWKDKLPGGKADKKSPKDFDKQALAQGTRHEMEHTKDKKLAMEIAMDHLTEDPKYYDKLKQIEKANAAHTFKDSLVAIDANLQAVSEQTASPELIQYLTSSISADLQKIPLAKGTLTVYKKEAGLYGGFFQDHDGQVVQEFENMSIAILAKTLEMKELYSAPQAVPVDPTPTMSEVRNIARNEASDAVVGHEMRMHNEENNGKKTHIRVRFGNFELEIKKSMQDFINDFKRSKTELSNKTDLKKAISSWRRNSIAGKGYKTDLEAARVILSDWEQYGEEFNQVLFALKMKNEQK